MMRIAIACAVLIGSTASIRADNDGPPSGKDRWVGVVVVSEGTFPLSRVFVLERLERTMGQLGKTVVGQDWPPEAFAALKDCFLMGDAGCARDVVERVAKPSQVVYVHIDSRSHQGRHSDVTLTAYHFQKGQAPVAEKVTCETCSSPMLDASVDMLINKLVGRVLDGRVYLRSKPTVARIRIDKVIVGATPLDLELPPGPHTIQMDLPGREATREVFVRSAETELVEMELAWTAKRRRTAASPAARKNEPVAREIDVDILETKRAGTRTQITVSRGSAAGVAIGTKGVLLDPHGNPLPATRFTIEKTTEDEAYAILNLPLGQLGDIKHARLRL